MCRWLWTTQAWTVHDHGHVGLFNKYLSCLRSARAGPAVGVDLRPFHMGDLGILGVRIQGRPGTHPCRYWRTTKFCGSQMLYVDFWLCGGGGGAPNPCCSRVNALLFLRCSHWFVSAAHSFYCSVAFHWDRLSIFQMMDSWTTSNRGLYINILCKFLCEHIFLFL